MRMTDDQEDIETIITKLHKVNVRESCKTIKLWKDNEQKIKSYAGSKIWDILENVYYAALDVHDESMATSIYNKIFQKFSSSNRVEHMFSLYVINYRLDKVESFLPNVIKEYDNDPVFRKHQVSYLKSLDKIDEAIELLKKYLEIFMQDAEAWMELSCLYLSVCEYDKAAFCMEELILINPSNDFYHERYAQIKYSCLDSFDNVEIALKSFCQAYSLNNFNVRALYGILLVCFIFL
ncbi:TPR repeat protein 35 [Intoshia linei]|uniref:ER membrane protein complex subunit 2 n=1 Tax=Intoshia linei TaxID=1819745 RepID=A0A177ASU6_9BILA|nr:TPR repeat protein 35 [Intoshia linei]